MTCGRSICPLRHGLALSANVKAIPAPLDFRIVRASIILGLSFAGLGHVADLSHVAGLSLGLGHVDVVTFAELVILAVLVMHAHLGVPRDRDERLPGCQVDQPNAHRLAARLLDLGGGRPDHAACRRDREDLVLWTDHECADQFTARLHYPRRDHTEAATTL